MGALRQFSEAYSDIPCANCGLVFSVPSVWDQGRRENGAGFFCPNGHSLSYRESEADKLRKRLAEAERKALWERERAATAERKLVAAKGETTKLRKRIANGVCPDCHRHFTNLERHIATKHAPAEPEVASK